IEFAINNDELILQKNHILPARTKSKTKALRVAPDGEIPNSLMFKIVEGWKNEHKQFKIIERGVKYGSKKKSAPKIVVVDADQKKKSDQYKEKLKKMLYERKMEEEKAEEEEKVKAEKEIQFKIEEENNVDIEIEQPIVKSKLQQQNKLHYVEVLTLPPLEIKYPILVEKALQFTWIPEDE
ncbi:hypothetical protein HK096_002017, partial [Nowakowskiella sp. JEL0078]